MHLIREITALETFPVRHPVLRAGKPLDTCHFEGDSDSSTRHFGYFIDDTVVGVATVVADSNKQFGDPLQFRLRGMAVLPEHRKKRIGEALLKQIELQLKGTELILFWFNARIIAIEFYEKCGYQRIGDKFDMGDIGPHYVMYKRL